MRPNRLIALVVAAGIASAAVSAAACSKTSPSATPSATATHSTTTQPPHPVSYSAQVVLPFGDYINHLAGVAVDTVGNVYVLDYYYGQAWKLAAGANTLTKPFTDLGQSTEVAVDTGGNLYVLDDNSFRVLKLAAQ
jgi:hypothetical protein